MNLVANVPAGQWLRQPLDAWSKVRLAVTGVIVGLLVFCGATVLWQTSDMSGTDSARTALQDANERLSRAKAIVEKIPELRASAGNAATAAQWTIADALRDATALAAQSGLRIGNVEPAAQKGEGLAIERPLRVRAEGSFNEIQRFLAALDSLPRLVVPADIQMKRGPSALQFDATLRVFEALPPIARSAGTSSPASRELTVSDPFNATTIATSGDTAATQLVGTLRDRRHALALLQTADGVQGFAQGISIGGETLGRIRSASVDMTTRDGRVRTLALQEDLP